MTIGKIAKRRLKFISFLSHLLNCLTNDYGVMKNEINKIYNLISTKHDEQEIFNLQAD